MLILTDTIRYDNVCSKADIGQLNLPYRTKLKTWKKEKTKTSKSDTLRCMGKQSGESMQSVHKKKRKAIEGKICRKGRF